MKRCKSSSRPMTAAVMTAAVIAISGSAFAQTVDDVLREDLERLELAQQAQEQIDQVVEGTRSLTDQYRAIDKEIEGLEVYNRLMSAQVEGQEATLADIALSMDQVESVNRQIFPLMTRMIDGLEQSIQLDIPFLMEERMDRVANLREIMERSDVSVAEKFRKVMEAYQIEMDYGSSSEQYTHPIDLDGDGTPRDFNMLRIGRVGLYFQSDDGQITGHWNAETGQFEELDSSYRNEIRKGLRMARQLIAPELLLLPVPGATDENLEEAS